MWISFKERFYNTGIHVGDHVRIQNQVGNHPNKWDKTGVVIEVHQYHQYVIRVDGSGRITLRNRKFYGNLLLYINLIREDLSWTIQSTCQLATPLINHHPPPLHLLIFQVAHLKYQPLLHQLSNTYQLLHNAPLDHHQGCPQQLLLWHPLLWCYHHSHPTQRLHRSYPMLNQNLLQPT